MSWFLISVYILYFVLCDAVLNIHACRICREYMLEYYLQKHLKHCKAVQGHVWCARWYEFGEQHVQQRLVLMKGYWTKSQKLRHEKDALKMQLLSTCRALFWLLGCTHTHTLAKTCHCELWCVMLITRDIERINYKPAAEKTCPPQLRLICGQGWDYIYVYICIYIYIYINKYNEVTV